MDFPDVDVRSSPARSRRDLDATERSRDVPR